MDTNIGSYLNVSQDGDRAYWDVFRKELDGR